jgi:protein gp37
MSDLYHPDVPEEWLAEIFNIMADTGRHTYQVLTKRSSRQRDIMYGPKSHRLWSPKLWHRSVLPNVWLGVSVEDAEQIGRVMDLSATPAAHRFVSFEPLLGDVGHVPLAGIDWVIVGAESGPRARPMNDDWVRSIRDQCTAAGVPFLFKQRATTNGHKISLPELDGRQWTEFPKVNDA